MKQVSYFAILICVTLCGPALAQQTPVFTKGEKAANVHHIGNVWLKELNMPDSVFTYGTSVAMFDPGARLDWHTHPGGQILIITEGVGFYQEKGKAKKIVRPGDVVRCLPGVEHWHGATHENGVTYIATSPAQNGKTIWLHKVSDEEYNAQRSTAERVDAVSPVEEMISLSKKKWDWMAEKNVDSLSTLFHEKAAFVHMGGSMSRTQELNTIKSGGIHYKKPDIQNVTANIIDNTAIVLSKIRLLAVVGGKEVTNPFVVTEVYVKQKDKWMLGSLSFTRLLGN